MDGKELAGQVAVVTGRATGIGRAIAGELNAAGAAVVIADKKGAQAAAEELGPPTLGLEVDVASEQDTAAMGMRVSEEFGRIDILINNAGLFTTLYSGPFDTIPLDEWGEVMNVNVLGVHLCSRAVVGAMRRQRAGVIVNLTSGTAFKGTPYRLHYVTSKGAIIALTRALGRELGADGIRVNAIAPGLTLSPSIMALQAQPGLPHRTGRVGPGRPAAGGTRRSSSTSWRRWSSRCARW